jgi:uncharacterized protein (UPF0276 family)
MLFSINYSTQASVLYRQNRLPLGRFKCPDWPELIAEARQVLPVAVHFNLFAGRGRLKKKNLDLIERIADESGTPYVNLHLEAKIADYPAIPVDSSSPEHRMLILDQMFTEVDLAVRRFGRERVILENIPYRSMGSALRLCVEPELITRVVEETGCGFLFDIPHARISAHNLGIDEREYICRLPVVKLKELHFTGVHYFGSWLQDHLPAQAADWSLLEWVLERIRLREWGMPWMLAFEYGGVGEKFTWRSSAQEIETQGTKLHSLVSQI